MGVIVKSRDHGINSIIKREILKFFQPFGLEFERTIEIESMINERVLRDLSTVWFRVRILNLCVTVEGGKSVRRGRRSRGKKKKVKARQKKK